MPPQWISYNAFCGSAVMEIPSSWVRQQYIVLCKELKEASWFHIHPSSLLY